MVIAIRFKLPMDSDYMPTSHNLILAESDLGVNLLYIYKHTDGYLYLASDDPTALTVNITRLREAQEVTAYLYASGTSRYIGIYDYDTETYTNSSTTTYSGTLPGELKIAQGNNFPVYIVNVLNSYVDRTPAQVIELI